MEDKVINDQELVYLYCEKLLTTWQIAEIMGIAQATVCDHLRKLGKIRSKSEAQHVRFLNKPLKRYIENNGHGYREIYMPEHPNVKKSGYILEHRYTMSQLLNRPLKADEQVHHLNGNPQDNRPENLVLVKSNKEHKHFHRMSDEELLEKLRKHAQKIGRPPTVETCQLDKDMPSAQTYKERFGSWNKAKILAGVLLPKTGPKPK
jgi:hypothetical protein